MSSMKKLLVTKNLRRAGFSLLELSIVITIAGIMLYSIIAVGLSQIEAGKITATKDKLDKINIALTLFYKTNGYLPCPAPPAAAASSSTFGTQSRSGSAVNTSSANGAACNATGILASTGTYPSVYMGVVPTRTISLPDDYMYDSWGNRITYTVSRYCVSAPNYGSSTAYPPTPTHTCYDGTTTTTNGNSITVRDLSNNTIATAAYAVISHGKNGVGAFNRVGTKTARSGADSTPEESNANLNTSTGAILATGSINTYVYDVPFNDGVGATNFFDDLIRWRTASQVNYDANK